MTDMTESKDECVERVNSSEGARCWFCGSHIQSKTLYVVAGCYLQCPSCHATRAQAREAEIIQGLKDRGESVVDLDDVRNRVYSVLKVPEKYMAESKDECKGTMVSEHEVLAAVQEVVRERILKSLEGFVTTPQNTEEARDRIVKTFAQLLRDTGVEVSVEQSKSDPTQYMFTVTQKWVTPEEKDGQEGL